MGAMDNPTVWAVIWLAVAGTLGVAEIVAAGTFFFLPFAAGALAASLLSFLGAPVAVGWLTFVGVSFVSFLAMRPLARRMNAVTAPSRVGANRLIGEPAVVLATIPSGAAEVGLVRINREEWRAESTVAHNLEPGTRVRVVEVTGTRVIVEPITAPALEQP
jgi:membrane protein implicated in regulation of membrane protease activity